jgi:SAM-dependent methyltransferase
VGAPREEPSDDLVAFYTEDYDESARLSASYNELEILRTREILATYLPPAPARVIDIGGGTGAYAAWLAELGYEVDLVDVVPSHVERAKEIARQLPHGFVAHLGDARSLPAAEGEFDVALLLGPLYHLQAQTERERAFAEAVRVTRPGGVVVAAAISRYAWPLYALRDGVELNADRVRAITATVESGVGDPHGSLPLAYSHRPDDLLAEAERAGLTDARLFGIEGPGWIMLGETPRSDQRPRLEDALHAARLLDGHPDVAGASAHMLVVGRRPGRND